LKAWACVLTGADARSVIATITATLCGVISVSSRRLATISTEERPRDEPKSARTAAAAA
jgi:hypothetical protein